MSLSLRKLELGDYHKGFLQLLGQLTTVGCVSEAAFAERLGATRQLGSYHTVVIEDIEHKKIVATATLIVEHKFTHECGQVGHIEDVVVDSDYRGQKLGQRVLDELMKISVEQHCYKVILDCADSNVGFYEKCGLERKGVQMGKYF